MRGQITKTLLVLAIVTQYILIYGQSIKTYNGKYEKGKAVYQYYEKSNGERVYHGKFEYSCEDFGDNFPYQTISGFYKDGLKDGRWLFVYTPMHKNCFIKKEYNYLKGALDGNYYEERYFSEKDNGQGKITYNYKYNFNYKNNRVCGFFKFENLFPFTSLYQGSIDSLGFANGDWLIIDQMGGNIQSDELSIKIKCQRKYKNGILLKSEILDTEKGKLLESIDNKEQSQLLDTTWYKISLFKNEHKYCESRRECSTNNADISDLISKGISFDFWSKVSNYEVSSTGRLIYKNIIDTLSSFKNKYLSVLNGISIKYTGNFTNISSGLNNIRAKQLAIDTSVSIMKLNNEINEVMSKLHLVSVLYKYAFTEQGNPQERIVNIINADVNYKVLFTNETIFAPNDYFQKLQPYIESIRHNYYACINKLETPLKNIFSKEEQLNITRKKASTIVELQDQFNEKIDHLEGKYNAAKQVRILKKNYSINNIYLIPLYTNLKAKIDKYTEEVKANNLELDFIKQDVPENENSKRKLEKLLVATINRDSLLKETEHLLGYIPKLTIAIEENRGNSHIVNGLINSNSDDLEILNPVFFKRIYSIYIPETLEQISKSNEPSDVIVLFKEIEKILKRVENEAQNNNEEFAKKLKKASNKQEIINLVLN